MVVKGPTYKLTNGAEMPAVGLGTWMSEPGEVGRAVHVALDSGYRLIDTAEAYGNEKEIGDALQEYFKAGKIKREEIFITTKVFIDHFQPKEMEAAIKRSLSKLQLDYVDLYLAHAPAALKADKTPDNLTVEQVWQGLEKIHQEGFAKAIGVSNFSPEQIERIMKIAKVPIHNSQNECYLYWPQKELVEVCRKHNIIFTAYSPLGSPGRFNCAAGADPVKGWPSAPNPLEDPLVKKLAEKYHKTSAQILLRHLLQRGLAPIPKSVNEKRIKENWDIFDFELSAEEMKQLNSPSHQQHLILWPFLKGHPEDPWKSERD